MTDTFLIWWLSTEDKDAIGDACAAWPVYLRTQYESLRGRAGRGRLWVANVFGDVQVEWPAPETPLPTVLGCRGGIVIHAWHADIVHGLPGIITDVALKRWLPGPATTELTTVDDFLEALGGHGQYPDDIADRVRAFDKAALRAFISACSEEYDCAGWGIGFPEHLWRATWADAQELVPAERIHLLRELYHRAGGWWSTEQEFVETAEWERRMR